MWSSSGHLWAALTGGWSSKSDLLLQVGPCLPPPRPWDQGWSCPFKNMSGMRVHHLSWLQSFLYTDSKSPSLRERTLFYWGRKQRPRMARGGCACPESPSEMVAESRLGPTTPASLSSSSGPLTPFHAVSLQRPGVITKGLVPPNRVAGVGASGPWSSSILRIT